VDRYLVFRLVLSFFSPTFNALISMKVITNYLRSCHDSNDLVALTYKVVPFSHVFKKNVRLFSNNRIQCPFGDENINPQYREDDGKHENRYQEDSNQIEHPS